MKTEKEDKMFETTEHYICEDCGKDWYHTWDNDPNNDYTNCPQCGGFDFVEIDDSI